MSDFERFHVITGGPGSGKSTLIEALGRRGYARSIEAGRAIIQDQIAIDGPALPGRDPLAFAELMLSWELRSHRMAQAETGPVFFDRGVPDMVGYFHLLGRPVPSHVTRAAERFRYNRRVFLAPPWPAIFGQDAERKQRSVPTRRWWWRIRTAATNSWPCRLYRSKSACASCSPRSAHRKGPSSRTGLCIVGWRKP
jgi:predicted ATPase